MTRLLVCVAILAAVQGAPLEEDGMEVVDVGGGGIRLEGGGIRGEMEREKEDPQPELRAIEAQSETPRAEPESARIEPELPRIESESPRIEPESPKIELDLPKIEAEPPSIELPSHLPSPDPKPLVLDSALKTLKQRFPIEHLSAPGDGLEQREFPVEDLPDSEVAQDIDMLIFAIFGDDSYLDKDGELALGSRLMLEKDGEHVPDSEVILEKDGELAPGSRLMLEKDGKVAPVSRVILEKDRPLALSSIMKSPALAPRAPLLHVEGQEVFMRFANDD